MYFRYQNWFKEKHKEAERDLQKLVDANDVEGVRDAVYFKPSKNIMDGALVKNVDDSKPDKKVQTEIARILLDAGADGTGWGNDRLQIDSIENGNLEMVQVLEERGKPLGYQGSRSLVDAIEGKHFDIADFLIEKGVDVNARGGRILSLAAESGNVPLLKKVLSKVKDPMTFVYSLKYVDPKSEQYQLIINKIEKVSVEGLREAALWDNNMEPALIFLSRSDINSARTDQALQDNLFYSALMQHKSDPYLFNAAYPPRQAEFDALQGYFIDVDASRLDLSLSIAMEKNNKTTIEILKKLGADEKKAKAIQPEVKLGIEAFLKSRPQ